MYDSGSSPIAEDLRGIEDPGRSEAAENLLPLVYAELRRVAHGMIARERPGQALQPTALVHEAYLQVDEALQKLEAVDPRNRRIVDLRYFAGFTIQATAEALDVSATTIEREWCFIRAWLRDALSR